MKANELRIGNLVYYTIMDSLDERKRWDEVSTIDADDLSILEKKEDLDYKPIPLTEEWLLKFGFTNSAIPNKKDIYKDLTARMVMWFNDGNYAELDLIQDSKIISFKHSHVQYVHQLQNLYFALTSEELTIKE
jgi:hypothetical protein